MGNDWIDDPTTRPRTRTAPVAVGPRGVTLSKHFLRRANLNRSVLTKADWVCCTDR